MREKKCHDEKYPARIETWLSYVRSFRLPPFTPDELCPTSSWRDYRFQPWAWQARRECTERGMWAIVDKEWTKPLAEWIGGRKVLEVMAGAGWLAAALTEHGCDVLAADDNSWYYDGITPEEEAGIWARNADGTPETHEWVTQRIAKGKAMRPLYPVQRMDAVEAARRYRHSREVLVISWPHMNDTAYRICRAWGNKRPVVYIGEGRGGCTASDLFFRHWYRQRRIEMPQWEGLHDTCEVGYYTRTRY